MKLFIFTIFVVFHRPYIKRLNKLLVNPLSLFYTVIVHKHQSLSQSPSHLFTHNPSHPFQPSTQFLPRISESVPKSPHTYFVQLLFQRFNLSSIQSFQSLLQSCNQSFYLDFNLWEMREDKRKGTVNHSSY